MPLKALTDRGVVDAAIEEFDTLGREAFLQKYGFGEAKDYFLLTDTGRYDSKAIFAAAYERQHGESLGPDDFTGGKAGAGKWLHDVGYTVEGMEDFGRRSYFDSFDDARAKFRIPHENLPPSFATS